MHFWFTEKPTQQIQNTTLFITFIGLFIYALSAAKILWSFVCHALFPETDMMSITINVHIWFVEFQTKIANVNMIFAVASLKRSNGFGAKIYNNI